MIWILGLENAIHGLCRIVPGGRAAGVQVLGSASTAMLGVAVLCWLTCWFLDRHKVYLKV